MCFLRIVSGASYPPDCGRWPRFLGISEFGPRNILYHEGRKYRIYVFLPGGGPDQQDLEAAEAGILHELIESRRAGLHSGYSVGVRLDDIVATLSCHLLQVIELGLGMLIDRRHPHI